MSIGEYFGKWCSCINLESAKSILEEVAQKSTCPLPKDVYKAFRLCPLDKLRVVIIGQDPYPNIKEGKPVATGIAFGNSKDTPENSLSPSLEILRDSVIDFTIPHSNIIFDHSLEKWEEQGVLMLNTALTCEIGKPGSHILKWIPFMKSFLTNLSKQTTGIVYVLLGSSAKLLEPYIDKRFNHILLENHPVYYARTGIQMPSGIWNEINKILIGQNGYGITWYEEINYYGE